MAVVSTKDRGKGRRKKNGGSPSSRCFKGGGKKCGPVKRKLERLGKKVKTKVKRGVKNLKGKKITLEQANKNVKSANRARLKRKQEEEKKKPIPKLPTKKPKTIPVNTGKKKIIKNKPTPKPKPKPVTTIKKKTAIKTVPIWDGNLATFSEFTKKHYGSVTRANMKKVMSAYQKKKKSK